VNYSQKNEIKFTQMETLGKRLKYFIDNQGVNDKVFSGIIDIKPSALSEILSGTRPFGGNLIKKFNDKFPDISLNWLLFGAGTMSISSVEKRSDSQKSELSENGEYYNPEMPARRLETESQEYNVKMDPVKQMFLKYMADPDVQQMIKQIVK
jgi:hypothetical protein